MLTSWDLVDTKEVHIESKMSMWAKNRSCMYCLHSSIIFNDFIVVIKKVDIAFRKVYSVQVSVLCEKGTLERPPYQVVVEINWTDKTPAIGSTDQVTRIVLFVMIYTLHGHLIGIEDWHTANEHRKQRWQVLCVFSPLHGVLKELFISLFYLLKLNGNNYIY